MATNDTLKNQLTEQQTTQVDPGKLGFKALMRTPTMKSKFHDLLKDRSDSFMGSLLSLVNGDDYLSKAEPITIISSALKAASMELPIDKNLGYAYIVPFNRKEKQGKNWVTHNEAQFIIGYKGYIQLAQRSGQYKALNAVPVYDGEVKSWNKVTEEFVFDPEGKVSDQVVGYVAFFELLNGFKKTVYWTKQEIEAHRIKNAKGYDKDKLTGAWRDNYDAMATKTVIRNMLSKWGLLSVEMQNALSADEKVIRMDEHGDLLEEAALSDVQPIESKRKTAEAADESKGVLNSEEETELNGSLFDPNKPPMADDK